MKDKKPFICFSPLAFDSGRKNIIFAGEWCITPEILTELKLKNINYHIIEERTVTEEIYKNETKQCIQLFKEFIPHVSKELNLVHNEKSTDSYWMKIINPFLHQIIATFIDHFEIVNYISKNYPEAETEILDINKGWGGKHLGYSGSSRIYHYYVYSVIIQKIKTLNYKIIPNTLIKHNLKTIGDGKKSKPVEIKNNYFIQSLKKKLKRLIRPISDLIKGKIELTYFKYLPLRILALGDQYLADKNVNKLLKKFSPTPLYCYTEGMSTKQFLEKNDSLRLGAEEACPFSDSYRKTLWQLFWLLLPTAYLENYQRIKSKTLLDIPKKKIIILDSKNCTGGVFLDFFIALSTELYSSHYVMICHGGCYGVMKYSSQEDVWSLISNYYALWSNPIRYEGNSKIVKLPSLRFLKHETNKKNKNNNVNKKNVLLFITGYYPSRYAYNSIYPYTIDKTYPDFLVRFIESLNEDVLSELIVRDYHNSSRLTQNSFTVFAEENKLVFDSKDSFYSAVSKSKICVHSLPQTTYLETIVFDEPTICFWNTESNIFRDDLVPFYNKMFQAGVFHHTPESAAIKLNEISNSPLTWWRSPEVIEAVSCFKENVCYTSKDALSEWQQFINDLMKDGIIHESTKEEFQTK